MKTKSLKYVNLVKRYIDQYKHKLKLSDWEIEVKPDKPENDDSYLRIDFESFDYKQAVIYVGKRYSELDDTEKEEAAIHELSHIIVGQYDKVNSDIINGLIDLIDKIKTNALESVVDHVAVAIQEVRHNGTKRKLRGYNNERNE